MFKRKGRIENTPRAEWHDVDGFGVLIVGEIAYVQKSEPGASPFAVHIPTACVALAKPVLGKPFIGKA